MKTQFDKIYVLTVPSNKERINFINQMFNDLELNFEFIYGTDFGNIKRDSLGYQIHYPQLWEYETHCTGKDFGCTVSHYNAVYYAYELNYNNVLIVEDDICFIKNKDLIYELLNNIPNDADFVTYDPRLWFDNEFGNLYNDLKNSTELYIKDNNKYKFMFGSMIYGIMNRQTMKLYLDNQRKNFYISDHVQGLFMNVTVNKYICSKCICTDQFNIEYDFNIKFKSNYKAYKNNYIEIENLSKNDFYIPEKYQSFTRIK